MLTIEEVNSREFRCKKCGCFVSLIWIENLEQRLQILSLVNGFPIQFMSTLIKLTGCSIGEAKATYLHSTFRERGCHRCGLKIEKDVIVDCSNCNSINLVWG